MLKLLVFVFGFVPYLYEDKLHWLYNVCFENITSLRSNTILNTHALTAKYASKFYVRSKRQN